MTPQAKIRTLCIALFGASLAACSSVPERNSALDQSRERVVAARSDPQVSALAADELRDAEASVSRAEQAWTAGTRKDTVDHLAYLADQRILIARETAAGRAAQAVTAGAAAERDRMRLAERTAEADNTRRALIASEQRNQVKSTQLAAAESSALRDQASMEQSRSRVETLEAELTALNAKQTDRGMVVTLGGVLFYSGKSDLLSSGSADMIRLADFFKRNPQRSATIEGYTDSVGSAASNLSLSGRRANAVMAELVKLGVASDRLSTRAFGEEQPVAGNDTAAGRQMNRRVDIVFGPPPSGVSSSQ